MDQVVNAQNWVLMWPASRDRNKYARISRKVQHCCVYKSFLVPWFQLGFTFIRDQSIDPTLGPFPVRFRLASGSSNNKISRDPDLHY